MQTKQNKNPPLQKKSSVNLVRLLLNHLFYLAIINKFHFTVLMFDLEPGKTVSEIKWQKQIVQGPN